MGEEDEADAAARAASEADVSASAAASATAKRRGLIRRGFDLIPTSWFAAGVTAIFLAVTAAFGGLATVEDPVAHVLPGEDFHGAGFDMRVTGATIVDARKVTSLQPGAGQRVLLVALDATVTEPSPRVTADDGSLQGIRVEGVEAKPVIIRPDDNALATILQPGVRTSLLLAWLVPSDLQGERVTVRLPLADEAKNNIRSGTRWDFIRFGAETQVTVVDGGRGDPEPTA
ncbi:MULTISPECIES: hypothetical protein [unclassified Microbacterium]|uniref:hypothetical protein n=1 Tax=unclassified Microbacterium TaxID=2609290 RepID=UPI001ACE291F|nr:MULTISPECIES: hypothetical protein [unclassified Microbacterium]MBN9158847.1 hypothetical protein [Microbacterium sp.]MBS1901937.1 hypothetical protein [Actinomycetota bacterium]